MSKNKKAKVDINSVHSKLASKYKIKRDINTKVSSSIKDFKSVSDTIKKLEKIIDKGKNLGEKDKDYNDLLKRLSQRLLHQTPKSDDHRKFQNQSPLMNQVMLPLIQNYQSNQTF